MEVNNIKFRLNSVYNGLGQYILYDNEGCEGNIILSGTTEIINGTSLVIINETINLTDTISINFIDINGCEICETYIISEPVNDCLPFEGTAIYLEPPGIYYIVDACESGEPPFTTNIEPAGINQRYILPGSVDKYYIYNGVTTVDDTNLNSSIQIAEGLFNCP